MGRKKVITTTTEERDDEQNQNQNKESENEIPQYSDPFLEFDRLFPNGNRKFKVARQTATGLVHVFSTTDVFDEDFLQEHYGGGHYLVRGFVDGIEQKKWEFRIEGPIAKQNGTQPQETKTETPQQSGSLLEQLLVTLVKDRVSAPPPTTTTVSELADAIKAVHSINPQQNGNGNEAKSFMEGFKEGLSLGKTVTGGSSETMDWKALAMDAIKSIAPVVQTAISNARGTVPPATSILTPQAAESFVNKNMDEQDKVIHTALQTLKQYCLKRTPPDLVVDWAAANADSPDVQNVVRAAFTRDFAAFIAIDPEIGNEPFVSWFKLVYDGLRSAFKENDNVDDDSTGESGDEGNTVDHEAPRTVGGKRSGD